MHIQSSQKNFDRKKEWIGGELDVLKSERVWIFTRMIEKSLRIHAIGNKKACSCHCHQDYENLNQIQISRRPVQNPSVCVCLP